MSGSKKQKIVRERVFFCFKEVPTGYEYSAYFEVFGA